MCDGSVSSSRSCSSSLALAVCNHFLKACDGVEAVNAVKNLLQQGETLNVIFLDSFMPNMGGIEACKQIRALGYGGLILAISGNVIPEDIQEFLDAGADYFLGKPFKLEQLQSVLSGTSISSLLPSPFFSPSHPRSRTRLDVVTCDRLFRKIDESQCQHSPHSLVLRNDEKDRKYSLSQTYLSQTSILMAQKLESSLSYCAPTCMTGLLLIPSSASPDGVPPILHTTSD